MLDFSSILTLGKPFVFKWGIFLVNNITSLIMYLKILLKNQNYKKKIFFCIFFIMT